MKTQDEPQPGRPQYSPAFTIIELAAVLIILFLVASIISTALARTRTDSSGFQCLNNHRQLLNAWRMYTDDNQGRLVYNHDGGFVGRGLGSEAWVGGWLDFSPSSDNTNTELLVNHKLYPYGAFLGPYVKTPRIFKCPADKSTAPIFGVPAPRVRSVSMNNFFGEGSRTWRNPSRFRHFNNIAEVKIPSQLFVFLDDNEGSINDGWFASDPDARFWLVSVPAGYHGSAGAFSFVDGHAQIHVWKDPRTVPVLLGGQYLPLNISIPGDIDIDWLHAHVSELK
jgi:prepilin-type processing-associated H-X9-DG protein